MSPEEARNTDVPSEIREEVQAALDEVHEECRDFATEDVARTLEVMLEARGIPQNDDFCRAYALLLADGLPVFI